MKKKRWPENSFLSCHERHCHCGLGADQHTSANCVYRTTTDLSGDVDDGLNND